MNKPEHESLEAGDEMPSPRRGPSTPVIIGVIVLIVVIIGGGFLAVRAFGSGLLTSAATPTPTLPPGSNLFYITTDPAWGQISIDGKSIHNLPAIGSTPLTLSSGGHTIVWNSPPFSPQTCAIYVPAQQTTSGVCSTNDMQPIKSGKDTGLQATVISFTAAISQLSAAQHRNLINTTQAFLDTLQDTDTVQPGEQFVDLNVPHNIATATQTLKATLHFHLDTNTNSTAPCIAITGPIGGFCQGTGGSCYSLCGGEEIQGLFVSGKPAWDIYGVVQMTWDYSTLDGQVIASDQPDVPDSSKPEYLVPFYVTFSSSEWHITDQFPHTKSSIFPTTPPSCLPLQTLILGNGTESSNFGIPANGLTSVKVNGQVQTLYWTQYTTGNNAAAGCLATVSQTPSNPNSATPVANASSAYCLYRFGVLLTVNPAARRYWPNLPTADAYEQGIAQNIARQNHLVIK